VEFNILIYTRIYYTITKENCTDGGTMQIEINGKNINYEVEGEGSSVILLHGWLASLETMKPIQRYLSNFFKVYNVDIIGFGKSDLPDKPMSTNDFGDFLKEFINKLNIENPILIGHSNGGKTIINYTGRKLGDAKKIVLIDSTGIKPKRKITYYIRVYTFKVIKNILKIFPNTEKYNKLREKALGKFGSSDYKASPEVLRQTMNRIINESQEEIMKNIEVPTLLIWGDKDIATPLQDAYKMEKLIKDSGVVVLKDGGHFSYLDNLNECLLVLKEFFKND